MAASITFDLDGVAQTVDVTNVKVIKQACYGLPTVFYNYFLRFMYTEDGVTFYDMTFRLYTETLAAITYEAANSAGMESMDDIKDSNTLGVYGGRDRSELYHGGYGFFVNVTDTSGGRMQATFAGDYDFYDQSIDLDPAGSGIAYPAPADTKVITNGVITDIPIIT